MDRQWNFVFQDAKTRNKTTTNMFILDNYSKPIDWTESRPSPPTSCSPPPTIAQLVLQPFVPFLTPDSCFASQDNDCVETSHLEMRVTPQHFDHHTSDASAQRCLSYDYSLMSSSFSTFFHRRLFFFLGPWSRRTRRRCLTKSGFSRFIVSLSVDLHVFSSFGFHCFSRNPSLSGCAFAVMRKTDIQTHGRLLDCRRALFRGVLHES